MKPKSTQNHSSIRNILSLLCLLSLFAQPYLSLAQSSPDISLQSVQDLATQKDEKKRELLEIRQKIQDLQVQINDQRNKVASLSNEIALYNLQIEQTQNRIEELTAEIEVTNAAIIELLDQINATESKIDSKKDLLVALLREIYRADQISPLEVVLQHDNFSDLLNQLHNTIAYQNQTQRLLDDLVSLKKDLSAKQEVFNQQKKSLEDIKGQQQLSRDNLKSQLTQKQGLLTATRGQESRYKLLLNEVSEEEAKINREVYNLDLAIRQKLGDKTLPPVSGALAWPMDGAVTQGYGNTGFTKLGYTFHNGIDIAAPPNTRVEAAADGVIYATGTGATAYGNWVVIRHAIQDKNGGLRNIMTLYGHLNKISVNSGQGVLRGDIIGLQGNTGNTTRLLYGPERGYHLHFTIFDEEGFGISDGAYENIYGPYQIPYGYSYNPMEFLK